MCKLLIELLFYFTEILLIKRINIKINENFEKKKSSISLYHIQRRRPKKKEKEATVITLICMYI